MSDAQRIKISVEANVLELCPIFTHDVLDLDAIVGNGTIGKSSEDILHFSLVENYVHPSVSGIIINNNEAIKMCSGSNGRVVSRDK